METERELLNAIHGGEKAALRRLYDRYSGYAMAIGLRYIPERDEVRDVLQDSFVKILTTISQFEYRGEGSLKSWVARIVSNKAIDHLRAQNHFVMIDDISEGRTQDQSSILNLQSSISDESDNIDDEPDIGSLTPEALTEMIGRLPPNYRTVLNLFVFEQRPHREIARQLGIKENTSSSIFFRAKRMLAKMIKEKSSRQ